MLKFIFNFIGSYGIVGPHQGYEAKLMLAGVKPIAQLPVFDPLSTPRDRALRKAQEDCAELTQAAKDGLIRSLDMVMPEKYGGRTLRFFCLPDYVDDMRQLADATARAWKDPTYDFNDIGRGPGEFLGYTKADIDVFANRPAYYSYAPRCLLTAANEIKRWCRAKSMLSEAWRPAAIEDARASPRQDAESGPVHATR